MSVSAMMFKDFKRTFILAEIDVAFVSDIKLLAC